MRSLLVLAVLLTLGRPSVLTKKDGWARVDGSDAAVRVTGFVNSPCPKGVRCIWSGQAVNLEYRVDKSTVPPTAWPYDLKVQDSDYKTKATVVVTEKPPKTP